MKKENLVYIKLENNQIIRNRKRLRENFIDESHNINNEEIKSISEKDLILLFKLYDKYFFNEYFKQNFRGKISFSLSNKMTRSAGKTIVPRNLSSLEETSERYEIRIGVNFFFHYYELKRKKIVNGIETKDALHSLLMVFEHELIHFIEFYVYKESNCKKNRFKDLAYNIFGHVDVYHSLPTIREIAYEKFGFKCGDRVCFVHNKKELIGIVNSINKRAAVMVLDKNGRYIDTEKNRYTKYYVSLNLLKKI
ncbi:hypothetical protein [Clostridium ganghwense]|uniref:SprT-like family protein n=1 Tax=Clostridium ganghwense TaxID=312089 RepID=A0ABT4CLG0_9CLOT|nr:hypothetical protein [Clostridium ganghwense]MCY6369086.1 hypothetical protein [Clostridium ganghwense]